MTYSANFADTYELQIVDIVDRPNQAAHPKAKVQGFADETAIVCEVLGTTNPEDENRPYKLWMFPFRDGTNYAWIKDGVESYSKGGNVLKGLGYDYSMIANATYQTTNFQALNGLYLKGPVFVNGKYLKCEPKGLQPLKNEEHIAVNQARKADVFNVVIA